MINRCKLNPCCGDQTRCVPPTREPRPSTEALLGVCISYEAAHEPEVRERCESALREWGLTFEQAMAELNTRGAFR